MPLDGLINERPKINPFPSEIIYIDDNAYVYDAVRDILRFDLVGWDTETTGLEPSAGARVRLSQFSTPVGRTYVFDCFKVNPLFHRQLFPNLWTCVGQNLKFDVKFLQYEYDIHEIGPLYDTMLAGQILSEGRVAYDSDDYLPMSLEDIAERDLGIALDKSFQLFDWTTNELPEQAIQYAARDSHIVLAIREKQIGELRETQQVRVAELEFDAVPPTASIENNGLRLHGERWERLYYETKRETEQVQQQLWDKLGKQKALFGGISTLNLNSRDQIMAAFDDLGIPVPTDKDGKRNTRSPKLKAYAAQYEEIRLLIQHRALEKKLSSYGLNWLDMVNPLTQRIHAGYRQIGAETGRYSCSKPNLQQIPKMGKYRNCFLAADGWLFVDADYSQMELRILADYCRDANFLRAFDEGLDLHRFTASLIFKVAYDAVTDKQRSIAKNLNFGIVYGIGVLKFAEDAGLTQDEARAIMDYYLGDAYPDMSLWLNRQAVFTLRNHWNQTMTGRRRKYIGDFSDDEYKARVQRNGKNLPVQGTSVDITKRALRLVYDEINKAQMRWGVRIVHVIHDEIILECLPQCRAWAEWMLKECMERAEREYLLRVPCVADTSVTIEWTKEATPAQLASAEALCMGLAP